MRITLTDKKKIFVNFSLYSLSNILQKGLGFFLFPLFTLFLTPGDLGIVSLVSNFLYLFSFIFTLSFESSIRRFYKEMKTQSDITTFIGTIITFLFFFNLIVAIFLFSFSSFFIETFLGNVPFFPYFFFAIINLFFYPYFSILQTLLQTQEEAFLFLFNSIFFFLLNIFLSLTLIIFFDFGALGQVFSLFFTNFFLSIYTILYLINKKLFRIIIDIQVLKNSLSYSLPFLPHLIGGGISIIITNILLNNSLSIEAVGFFNVTYKFISIIDILQIATFSAFTPWFFTKMSKIEQNRISIRNFIYYILKFFTLLSLLYSLYYKDLIFLILPYVYHDSWIIFSLLVIAFQTRLIYYFYEQIIMYSKVASKLISVASLIGNFVGISFTLIFTSIYGLFTPGLALLIHYSLSTIVSAVIAKMVSNFQIKLIFPVYYLFLLIFFAGLGFLIDYYNFFNGFSFFIKFILFITLTIILIHKDILKFRSIIKKVTFF
jgi:O-antigen/teichoic acid export membrane protein